MQPTNEENERGEQERGALQVAGDNASDEEDNPPNRVPLNRDPLHQTRRAIFNPDPQDPDAQQQADINAQLDAISSLDDLTPPAFERNLIPIYLVALYEAWNQDGVIPDADAPVAARTTNTTKSTNRATDRARSRRIKHVTAAVADYDTDYREEMIMQAEDAEISRNYRDHYNAVGNFVAGASILLRQAISLGDAKRAEAFFGRSFRAFADMGCPLTPNFHITMHLRDKIEKYGPVYGWWAYAFERMNGILGRFNLNGRGGGEIEATMLRGWLKTARVQDLVRPPIRIPVSSCH